MPDNIGVIPKATSGPISDDTLQSMINSGYALQRGEEISDGAAHLLLSSFPQLLEELKMRRQRMDLIATAVDEAANVTFLPTKQITRQ